MTAALACAALVLGAALVVAGARSASRGAAVRRRLHDDAPVTPAGALEAVASALPPPRWLAGRLRAAAVEADPAVVWAGWVLAGGAVGIGGLVLGGVGLGLVVVVLAAAGPPVALLVVGDRGDRHLEAALPEALESIARSLRSGASLRLAVGEAGGVPGALGADLATVARETGDGAALGEALDRWERRRPLPAVRLAVAAIGLGAETGGAHARAIDGVAETVRSRLAVASEVRALSSQARYSGLVIAIAPLGFAVIASVTDERTADFLLRSPLGLTCLGVGLTLDALAALWMQRLARIDP